MTPQQREVLILRFGLGTGESLSLSKVGKQLNVSRERVRQIERDAIKKLRFARQDFEGLSGRVKNVTIAVKMYPSMEQAISLRSLGCG